jgi:hypothetical protein
MTEEEEIEELNKLMLVPSLPAGGRRPRWKRIWWPTSYWPTRYSRTCGWWHLYWHIGAAAKRLHIRNLARRGC